MLPPAVVYIGGSGRSGSTLLARMLGQQPGFAAVGELRYVFERGVVENHLCGCGEPFRHCPFWAEVFAKVLGGFDSERGRQLFAQAKEVDRIRHIPAMAAPRWVRRGRFQEKVEEHAHFLGDLYATIAEVAGAATIVDSSKDPSYAFLLRRMSMEVGVVHLVRDSRAVAYSWTRRRLRPEIHWTVEYMRQRRPLRSGIVWTEYNLLFDAIGRQRGRFLRLRYEDFTSDPPRHVTDIVRWAGGPAPLGVAAAAAPFRHDISGNPIRFSPAAPVVRRDDEWRTKMPARQRRVVTAVTVPMLLRYRYRLDGQVEVVVTEGGAR